MTGIHSPRVPPRRPRAAPFIRSTRIWALLALVVLSGYPARGTQITGTVLDPASNPFNGTVSLTLSQPGQNTCASVLVAPTAIVFPINNGILPSFATILGNDCVQPQGTYYAVKFYDRAGRLAATNNWVVTGTTFDMGQAAPTSVTTDAVSYANPVLANANAIITGSWTFSAQLAAPIAGIYQTAVSTNFVTTIATTDIVTIPGLGTLGAGRCTFSARNSSAATALATTWIQSINFNNTINFNHPATAGMSFDFICTPH